jgi:hypothetical protein
MTISSRPIRLLFTTLVSMLVWGAVASSEAEGSIQFQASGTDDDGPLAATITFTAMNGGLEITITNTEAGTLANGQSMRALSFTVAGLSMPTAFTELEGVKFNPSSGGSWTLASGTPFDDTLSPTPPQPYAIDHWGFQTTGSSVLLATAGSPVPGAGSAQYMILPSSGTAGPGKSLADSNFFPYIVGPANFYLTVPGVTPGTNLTSANFTNVKVSFGTSPDANLDASPVPELSSMSMVLGVTSMLGAIALVRRRRRGLSQ